jgi:hypothetical protein
VVGDDLRRVSVALDVPLGWLLSFVVLAFVMLLAAVATHSETVGFVAAGSGLCITLLGVRAAIRPSRPFQLKNFGNSPWINSTRRVGLFYVMAGVVWAMLALIAAAGSGSAAG